MGIIRKTMSMGTAGLIDFRSDKERIARSTRKTLHATRAQTRVLKGARRDARKASGREVAALRGQQYESVSYVAPQPIYAVTTAPAGWYYSSADAPGSVRYWDGYQWTPHLRWGP